MACNTFIVSSTLRYRSSSVVASAKHHHNDHSILDVGSLKRDSFPHDFTFGAASAAYQYEGAAHKYGRGTSIWDTFTHKHPEKIADRSNGDRALDQYNRYKQDVTFMKDMNLDAYRFSISWSRILPNGKISGGINQEGIDYYNRLIDELIHKGLKPFVTIFHWDLPQALEDEYGGFLSRSIIDDYTKYAELCFKEFGGKVKHWITFNEPFIFSGSGYASGIMAPGRSSTYLNPAAAGEEPYLVSHHLLLAHAKAVKSYRESQNGEIGITLNSRWFEPFSHKQADQEAAKRALEFELGWYMKPLTSGHYPKIMRYIVGKRLPEFSEEEAHLIKGSFDFIGLNYYTSIYAANDDKLYYDVPDLYKDPRVNLTPTRDDGTPIGPVATGSRWLSVYPKGIRELLVHLKDEYKDPIIYITENGVNELNDPTLSLQESLMDIYRIDFYYRHLYYVHSAIFKHDVRVKGYFAWSLLDCFEWSSGYTSRFGLGFVDHNNNLERHEKLSARWFGNFLKKH